MPIAVPRCSVNWEMKRGGKNMSLKNCKYSVIFFYWAIHLHKNVCLLLFLFFTQTCCVKIIHEKLPEGRRQVFTLLNKYEYVHFCNWVSVAIFNFTGYLLAVPHHAQYNMHTQFPFKWLFFFARRQPAKASSFPVAWLIEHTRRAGMAINQSILMNYIMMIPLNTYIDNYDMLPAAAHITSLHPNKLLPICTHNSSTNQARWCRTCVYTVSGEGSGGEGEQVVSCENELFI